MDTHIILIAKPDADPLANPYLGYVEAQGLLDGCGFVSPAGVARIFAKTNADSANALVFVHIIKGVPQVLERWSRRPAGQVPRFGRDELEAIKGHIKLG